MACAHFTTSVGMEKGVRVEWRSLGESASFGNE